MTQLGLERQLRRVDSGEQDSVQALDPVQAAWRKPTEKEGKPRQTYPTYPVISQARPKQKNTLGQLRGAEESNLDRGSHIPES